MEDDTNPALPIIVILVHSLRHNKESTIFPTV